MDRELAVKLAEANVRTRDDLAELAVDELIRQEGKSTDKMTEGQTVVTYIYRKVEDGSIHISHRYGRCNGHHEH